MAEPLPTKCVAEFVGTFLLVFTVCCNIAFGPSAWGGTSIGMVLMVAIYTFAKVSGSNFNPAVSITLGLSQLLNGPGMGMVDVLAYIVSQVLGGKAATIVFTWIFKKEVAPLAVQDIHNIWQTGACETLYTFMLVFVVLNTAAARKYSVQGNEWFGMAIAFSVVAGAFGAGAVSGGCFNPAVAISLDTASHFKVTSGLWLKYTGFELVGSVLALLFYLLVRPGDVEDDHIDLTVGITPTISKLTSEFLGTYILVLTVGLNVLGGSEAGAFSIAASLTSMIYALGDVSGAHFNPAVTVAVKLADSSSIETPMVPAYMVVQCLGGIAAGFTYAWIYNGEPFALGPQSDEITWGQVAGAEVVFTAVLCMTVIAVAVFKTSKLSSMFGLMIGSCVTVGGFAIGGISGGSLNPAVSVGIAVSSLLNGGAVVNALYYSIFEIGGAVLAAGILVLTKESEKPADYVPLQNQ